MTDLRAVKYVPDDEVERFQQAFPEFKFIGHSKRPSDTPWTISKENAEKLRLQPIEAVFPIRVVEDK